MTPREVIVLALREGQDPVQFLIDYMAEKDSPVSSKWAEMMVDKYKEKSCLTNSAETIASAR